jgi:hypothetical protein
MGTNKAMKGCAECAYGKVAGCWRCGSRLALAAIAAVIAAPALGAPCSPLMHLAAAHDGGGYRTATPGMGVICERDVYVGAAGLFSNSIGRTSRYLAGGAQPFSFGPVRVGAVAGFMDGYAYRGGRAFPFAAITVSVPVGSVTARLMVVPKSHISPATLAVAVSF